MLEQERGVVVSVGRLGLGARPLPAPIRYAAYVSAVAVFVVILFVRGGPNPAETDAHAVTLPATGHIPRRTAHRRARDAGSEPTGVPAADVALRPGVAPLDRITAVV